jgi:hypothetical protein
MVSCPKFRTTSEYASKLRARLGCEEELITDAQMRGWPREVERHQATQRRILALLSGLGEPVTMSTTDLGYNVDH